MSLDNRKRSVDVLVAGLALVVLLLCAALVWGVLSANQETESATHSRARVTASGLQRQGAVEFKGTSDDSAGAAFRTLRRRSMGG